MGFAGWLTTKQRAKPPFVFAILMNFCHTDEFVILGYFLVILNFA